MGFEEASRRSSPPWRLVDIVEEIWDLANITSASFSHVKRQANDAADILAKDGVNRQQLEFIHLSD